MGNVSEKMRKWWLSWILFWVLVPIVHAESNSVRYFQTDERYAFRIALLQQVLDRSGSQCGHFSLQPLSEKVTQSRGQQLLEDNAGVDIAFLPTSISRERTLRAIKIPILSGILGYRVFLIRASDQTKFASVSSLEDLQKNYRGGFGSQWADMTILTHNGLNMYGVANYESLFSMLSVGRFDFFPRGINEAWQELALKKDTYPNLAVEQNIALYYPYPVYFLFIPPTSNWPIVSPWDCSKCRLMAVTRNCFSPITTS